MKEFLHTLGNDDYGSCFLFDFDTSDAQFGVFRCAVE